MLLDFVREYGDKSFEDVAMCDLDLLAFAELSNFDYADAAVGLKLPEALSGIQPGAVHIETQSGKLRHVITQSNPEDYTLAGLMMSSARYSDVALKAFRTKFEENSQQFAAIALVANDALVFAFRGTDKTNTGWKESLRLSLSYPMPSQSEAFESVHEVASKPGVCELPIVTCGHSKGGNLALYAATQFANLGPEYAARIAAVTDFDGLGLVPAMRQTKGYQAVAPLTNVYIPSGSIVGPLCGHAPEHVEYIASKGLSVNQHYVYLWETKGTEFVPSAQSFDGKILSGGIQLLIKHLSDEQKDALFNAIFGIRGGIAKLLNPGSAEAL